MNIPVQNCSSCAACVNACARNAITMQLDAEGFYRPVIDAEKCVKCGMCERVCPWNKPVENPNAADVSPKTVAAYAKNESVRLQSSSGGIFTVLAERILDDGGVVVGVAQLGKAHFGHIVVVNKAELSRLRGSKYVQADVGLVYQKIRSLLKAGRKVLFSGTPCQVAGLYAVLGNAATSADLFTVDVVCHGSPSVKVFEKYVAEIEKDKSALVNSTRFRDKRNGWRLFSMTSSLNTISGDCFQFSKTLREDKFMRVFLQNICLNTSCADCHYGKLPRIADITLGDYWNIAQVHPEMDDNKGTSVVLLNTAHSRGLFDSITDKVVQCESSVDAAIAGNPCIVRSSKQHPKRVEFFSNLDKYALDLLVKMYCPYPTIVKKLYYRLREVLGKIKRMGKMYISNLTIK
ncbi:Coenzyme F420 hydrogenase/dehydrogenase, beta subunit C-terminal domain [Fibrobacter sp. UBA4297]|uniref:Coenzyme F420 hydrogenase/dehydrogenase, beta subunit C-terminal domain n=1 Tax=Fibrobacter sp. UBA4297 TaxID=1946536 RepID=UPI0025BABE3D|nr:Coenzyme F420 hydrogenase/dehydrogenase, beta subunit C-terminal domain [Fibrobacter sp. UBA4297]